MAHSFDFRLHWVVPDPDQERAVDPLGLGAQADRIADWLMPGVSVQTRRARYVSFFCWAVRRTQSERHQLGAIHRLEAELACEEAKAHGTDGPQQCPDIVGRQRALRYLLAHEGVFPRRPEALYKNMAFAAYRPLMKAIGLLAPGRKLQLTSDGNRLAIEHQRSRGRRPRCLSNISAGERTRLRLLFGLDFRKQPHDPSASARRRATFVELHRFLERGLSSTEILESYSENPNKASPQAYALHHAFAWETLSLGLTLAFAMVLERGSLRPIARRIRDALSGALRFPGLRSFAPSDEAAGEGVIALLRRAHRLRASALRLDPYPYALAERLVVKRDVDGFLSGLLERHRQTKPGDAWVANERGVLRVLAPKKNLDLLPRPRTYRLDAFAQLLRDLGLVP
jgi:hypothetical protein